MMIQYVKGADPAESAARRERMRYAEENGETDEVIRNMALVATTAAEEARMGPILHTEDPETGQEPDPTERVSALARIGTIPEHTTDPVADPAESLQKKD